MHPKQIIADFKSLGAALVLDGNDLYIEHPENVYQEIEELAKVYKARIVAYLKNDYSEKEHNIFQTVDKILNFYVGIEQDMNKKINDWLNHDDSATKMIMKLCVDLSKNGWKNPKEPIANYEDQHTFQQSVEIYNRAMSYFRGK